MRALIVLGYELLDQRGQFLIVGPGLVAQPLLQRAHKSLGNAIGLWSMARNADMDKCLTARQFLKDLGREVYARSEIRNCNSWGNHTRSASTIISAVTLEPATNKGRPKYWRALHNTVGYLAGVKADIETE